MKEVGSFLPMFLPSFFLTLSYMYVYIYIGFSLKLQDTEYRLIAKNCLFKSAFDVIREILTSVGEENKTFLIRI